MARMGLMEYVRREDLFASVAASREVGDLDVNFKIGLDSGVLESANSIEGLTELQVAVKLEVEVVIVYEMTVDVPKASKKRLASRSCGRV